ncbi:MAG: hypothetical protein ACFFE1_11180, partial [Candidatus Thorarchaeota archaeon]
PAAEYDFTNRREPISILVYNEYSDNLGGGEYDHTMGELQAEYGYRLEFDNLTDYTSLDGMIADYDVLLIVEQELATYAEMDTVASAWSSFLPGWVDEGGVLICMDYYTPTVPGYGQTARILNSSSLMRTYNTTSRTSISVTITDSFDPLAFGVSAYSGPDGTYSFDTPDGNPVFSSSGQTVVAHRYLGLGHVVMLGFDLYAIDPNPVTILGNAVRLTRLAVFDYTHNQQANPYGILDTFSLELTQYGFAIATMDSWDATLIQTCEVFVVPNTSTGPLPFSTNEIDLLDEYVAAGGGLLLMTDYWDFGNNTDGLLERFGYARNYSSYYFADTDDNDGNSYQPTFGADNLANHSTTFGVTDFKLFGGTAFEEIPAGATPIIWSDSDGTAIWGLGPDEAAGLTIAAASHHGAGRVFAISDGDWAHSPYVSEKGNLDFGTGIMCWLSAAGLVEKTVLFDNSKIPAISLSSFNFMNSFLAFNGFNLMWMNDFYEDLVDQADVLIIPDGSENYTISEIGVIVDFVSRGGGLFVLADNTVYCEQVNPVVAEFGLQYNNTGGAISDSDDYISATTYIILDGDNIANHPIMTGVERIELDLNNGFVTVGTGTALLSTDTDDTASWTLGGLANGVPVFAATTFGMGRVVAIADYNLPATGDYDGDNYINLYDSDNDVFFANAFFWFIQNRAPIVEVVFPNGGELLNGTHFIEWTAADANRDELTFEVFISDNNGSDWSSLAGGIHSLQYEWNTTLHDDGTTYKVRVVASDGFLTGQDDSDGPFELDNFAGGPGFPIDPTLLAIIGGVVVVVLIIVVVLSKKRGEK